MCHARCEVVVGAPRRRTRDNRKPGRVVRGSRAMDVTLEDRARITDLVVAYAFAIDERNWQAFEALFTPDASIDYRSAGGIAGAPKEVAAWMPQAISLFTWTLHSVA